ncbi:MAG: radical SAM protein [Candidatus Omnitrophica bacterium]|nr:radical SAM protein [Candidatus Omnitrophota bacterium]
MEKRIPYMGALELTYRCNLNCQHCFCNLSPGNEKGKDELSLKEIKRLIDEMVGIGCLWLLLTGGEPLLRKDFLDIYDYAISRGVLLEIFTNAALITDEIAKKFAQEPPLGIEISVYGASAQVYDSVSRVHGSFDKAMKGIGRLKKHGVGFGLKTVILKTNVYDLQNMQMLADSLGADFKFDCLVCPRKDGGMGPLAWRLSTQEAAAFEFCDESNLSSLEELFGFFWKRDFNDMVICSAGINSFNVDPYGNLSPCTMYKSFQYSLCNAPFGEAWVNLVKDYGNGPNDFLATRCKDCSMVSLCPNCPAWAELETGHVDKPVDYLCKYALMLEKEFFSKQKGAQYDKKTLSKAGN